MKTATITALCVMMSLAMALADYGSYGYGGYSYVPVHPGGVGGGVGDGGILMLIGLLFLLTFLFSNNSFFNRNTTSGVPVTLVQG